MHLVNGIVYCMLMVSAASLSALELGSEFNGSGRYHHDSLQRTNRIKFTPTTLGEKDQVHATGINAWQWGFDGRFMMPPTFCGFWGFLKNFYVDGFAYWGYGGKGGRLHETLNDFDLGIKLVGKAKLTNAQTSDYQVGLGYLFNWCEWALGISSGYSYDKVEIKTTHGKTSDPYPAAPFVNDPIYGRGYRTISIWEGPWAGAKLFYNWCAYKFDLGYEFHYGRYSDKHGIPDNPIAQAEGLSDKVRAHHAYGNVVFLDAHYYFCDGFVVGGGFKYQYWYANNGRLTPRNGTFVSNGFPATTRIRTNVNWSSYSLTADIGYYF